MLAYVNTSVWISRIEGKSSYKTIIENCMEEMKQSGWHFCISQAVMMESLYKPYRDNNRELMITYIGLFGKTKLLPNYTELFEDGLWIMQTETLKTMDALHVALAAHYGCEYFITADTDFRHCQAIPVYWIDLSPAASSQTDR